MDDRTEVSSHSSTDARYQFWLEEDWLRHIRDEHMQPYAWYMGDGPRSSLGMTDFLFDCSLYLFRPTDYFTVRLTITHREIRKASVFGFGIMVT
jgi:hypothetical protein